MKQSTVTLTTRQIATVFHAGLETGLRYPNDDPFSFTREKIEAARLYAVFDALNVDRHEDFIPLVRIKQELAK